MLNFKTRFCFFLLFLAALPLIGAEGQAGPAAARFERQAMGEWKIGADTVQQLDPKETALLLSKGDARSRYSAAVGIRLPGKERGEEAGLVLQFTDTGNYVVFSVQHRKSGPFAVLRIVRSKPGLSFVLDQAPLAGQPGDWFNLRAEVNGTDIYGFVNGKPVLAWGFRGQAPPYNSHGNMWPNDPDKGRAGVITVNTPADFKGFRTGVFSGTGGMAIPTTGRFDQRGRLLPKQSYSESMRLFTDWFLNIDKLVDKAKAPKPLQNSPVYLLTNFVSTDDRLWDVGGEFAFNHSLLITGAVQYFTHTGERKYLDMARNTADWEIENSTPSDWALPYLAASFVKYKDDGTWEGMEWGYEPDKSAYLGYALLRLHAVTNEKKYLDAALRIAGTLQKFQNAAGDWPFRVNARTGEVKHGYTCSQLWYVWFYERLAELTGRDEYLRVRDRAFQWLLENPVRTNEWIGLYGDIQSGARSFDQWVALETAMYLIDRRAENPLYLEYAQAIADWINRILVTDYGFFPGVPGVVEQSQYRVVLTHHELRLAEIYGKLWEATGNAEYKDLAIAIGNSVTWNYLSDGKIRQGFWFHAQAVPLVLSFNEQYARLMASVPETAPREENHLLQTTSLLRDVRYAAGEIRYRTVRGSFDTLVVARQPKEVLAGGQPLPRKTKLQEGADGWTYEAPTGRLRIRHSSADVTVALP